jgi:hypothetical protein
MYFSYEFKATNLVVIATGYGLNGRVSILGRGKGIYFTASKLARRPTQPPTYWLPEALSPRESCWYMKLITHLHLVLKSRTVELHLHSSIHLRSVVIN